MEGPSCTDTTLGCLLVCINFCYNITTGFQYQLGIGRSGKGNRNSGSYGMEEMNRIVKRGGDVPEYGDGGAGG